jgi:hypothetical protein
MKDVKINISSAGFPSQFVSDSEKKTSENSVYRLVKPFSMNGLEKDGAGCRYYSQWGDFHRLRLYARGEQSVGKI